MKSIASAPKGRSAEETLIMAAIDPISVQGDKPVIFCADMADQPKMPFNTDNSFQIYGGGNTTELKIMPVASPIISHVLYSKDGIINYRIGGAVSKQIDPNTAVVYAPKSEQLGAVDHADGSFRPSSDWDKYRVLGVSSDYRWSGPVVLANGVTYTARTNEPLELADFEPTSVSDCITAGLTEPISVTAQHNAPTFDVQPIGVIEGSRPPGPGVEVEDVIYSTHENSAQLSNIIQTNSYPITAEGLNTLTINICAKVEELFTSNFGMVEENVNDLFKRYGLSPGPAKTEFDHKRTLEMGVELRENGAQPGDLPTLINIEQQTTTEADEYTAEELADHILILPVIGTTSESLLRIANSGIPATATFFSGSLALKNKLNAAFFEGLTGNVNFQSIRVFFTLSSKLKFTSGKAITKNAGRKYHRSQLTSEVLSTLASSFMVDKHFKLPVTSIQSTGLQISVTSKVLSELVPEENTPYMEPLKANAKKGINQKNIAKYSKLMSLLPPALIQGKKGLALEGRGLVGDLVSFAGPMIYNIINKI